MLNQGAPQGSEPASDRDASTVIKKRTPGGNISTHAAADFRSVECMTVMPDGTLFLMDAGNVRRISPEATLTTVVNG